MSEDRLLKAIELGSRPQAELSVERQHGVAIGLQGGPLATRAVQSQHQLGAEALPQRVVCDQALELAHQLHSATKRKLGLDPVFDGSGPQVFEPGDLRRRKGLKRDIGERRAAPLLERQAQPPSSALGPACHQRPATLFA
jgi:hypothetical protein